MFENPEIIYDRFISTLANQELINAVAKDVKYIKIIQMNPINSQCQMAKFEKFTEKLTATQSVSSIIWNVKCATKKKHILGKQKETIPGDLKLE